MGICVATYLAQPTEWRRDPDTLQKADTCCRFEGKLTENQNQKTSKTQIERGKLNRMRKRTKDYSFPKLPLRSQPCSFRPWYKAR